MVNTQKVGEEDHKRGKLNWKERDKFTIAVDANKFADKIYNAVVSNMDYK